MARGERQLTDLNRDWKAAGRAGAPGALPVRAGRLHHRRLGDAAGRLGSRASLPCAPQHPRRAGQPVRPPLLRRVPGVRRRGLRRCLREPAGQPGLQRGVRAGGRRGLGRRRLRRRDGGARRGAAPLRLHRPRPARGDGRELWRLHDELDRRPHGPLPGRVLRARRQRDVEHVRDQRHRLLVPGGPRGRPAAVGGPATGTSSAPRSPTRGTSARRS